MDMIHYIETPLTTEKVRQIKAGDRVVINGIVYTARDAAHKKMAELIERGEQLPFDISGQIIYYVGPCPARPGEVIGSAGPTTSGRMDAYAPKLIELGLKGMVGKGLRSEDVIKSMKKYGAVYLGAIGGAGALIARSVIKQEMVAFPELGPEAIRKLTVKDFLTIAIIDASGNNLYETGPARYRRL